MKKNPFEDLYVLSEEILEESYEILKKNRTDGFAMRQIAEVRGLMAIPMKFDMCKTGEDYIRLSEEVRLAYARLIEMRKPNPQ